MTFGHHLQITGRRLNREWKVGAKHALYREDGRWYHVPERFPGALFDANGYILFRTEADLVNCRFLSIGEEVNVHDGISSIPGYVRVR